ncbi:hypothetical protein TR2A62_1189 [Thalassobium sp. R2A62]|jgi:hypothetical protein|nr:hypothetical protein TR2A62_1189 [Thalassobium sp. R2A62]
MVRECINEAHATALSGTNTKRCLACSVISKMRSGVAALAKQKHPAAGTSGGMSF